MSELTDLQEKRNADERFLSHRETHRLLTLQAAAITELQAARRQAEDVVAEQQIEIERLKHLPNRENCRCGK